MKNDIQKPTLLVTNDDGIDSPFLKILVQALQADYEVRVVAPLTEQSWIGKAISRRRRVQVKSLNFCGSPGWSVDGTPADCVNIALGNLMKGEDVVAVVSGINIGYNASLPTVLSSGTVGAGLEAALLGLPAIALSKSLPSACFELLQRDRSQLPQDLEASLIADADRVTGFVRSAVRESGGSHENTTVHNYNFPYGSSADTQITRTSLAHTLGASIFEAVDGEDPCYEFCYQQGQNFDSRTKTDLNCLNDGHISYTLIDFTRLTLL